MPDRLLKNGHQPQRLPPSVEVMAEFTNDTDHDVENPSLKWPALRPTPSRGWIAC